MFGFITRSIRLVTSKIRIFIPTFLLVPLCSIALWNVLDNSLIHSVPLPAAVIISNKNSSSVTVTGLMSSYTPLCAFAYGFSFPPVVFSCDASFSHRTHSIVLKGLAPTGVYKLLLGWGVRWFTQYVEPVYGNTTDKSLIRASLPTVRAAGFGSEASSGKQSVTISGRVWDVAYRPQSQSLILASIPDGSTVSTIANEVGQFELVLPPVSADEIVNITIWSDAGYYAVPIPAGLAAVKKHTMVVQPYEK